MNLIPYLAAVAPNLTDDQVAQWAGSLEGVMDAADITTPKRIAAFLANCAHESAQFTQLVENLNYSADALMRTWPRRFTPDLARAYERQPEKIANLVYAGRMGNIDPDDGWRYRGRGLMQITGRDNYHACSLAICNGNGKALLDHPDYLELPDYAAAAACWYWTARDLNPYADTGNFDAIADLINRGHVTAQQGDAIHYDHRWRLYQAALKVPVVDGSATAVA